MLKIYYADLVWLSVVGVLLFLYGVAKIFFWFEASLDCREDNTIWIEKCRVYWIILAASVAFPVVALMC